MSRYEHCDLTKIISNLPTIKHYNITYALVGQCTKVQRTLIYPTSALYLCHLSSLKDIALFRTHRSVYLTSYCILPKYIHIHNNIEHLKIQFLWIWHLCENNPSHMHSFRFLSHCNGLRKNYSKSISTPLYTMWYLGY